MPFELPKTNDPPPASPLSITSEEHPSPSAMPFQPLPNQDPPPLPTAQTVAHNRATCACIRIAKGRNLVVNLDGTGNQFGEKSTNVVELFSRLKRDGNQLVYYDSGIGTYARPSCFSWNYIKQALDHGIDCAIAWNFEKIVQAAYKWLSENYSPGDRIFIFGFSRGAYEARVIAGMIEKVGLILKGNERQIPFAYELYCSITSNETRAAVADRTGPNTKGLGPQAASGASSVDPSGPGENRSHQASQPAPQNQNRTQASSNASTKEDDLCEQFKKTLCHKNVRVHFVGAWDTVSSIGILRGKSLPETASGMRHVCHFRHALALDERRAKFQPEYVNGGLGPQSSDKLGDVKEVWFAGSHSDIASLRWMTYEAMSCGLEVEPYEGTWEEAKISESLTWRWQLLECLPFGSLAYTQRDAITYRPHFGRPRIIQPGQLIHQSVIKRMQPLNTGCDRTVANPAEPVVPPFGADNKVIADLTKSEPENPADKQAFSVSEAIPSGSLSANATSRDRDPMPSTPSRMTSCFNSMLDCIVTFPSILKRRCTALSIHPKGGSRNLEFQDWDHFVTNHVTSTIVEKDPFENLSHTLQELKDWQNFSEYELDWDRLRALVSTLQSLLHNVHNEICLGPLQEIPEAGPILLSALQMLDHNQSQRMNVDLWEPLIGLLVHAKSIPRKQRLLKTHQLREWACVPKLPVKWSDWQRVLRSFGDGCVETHSIGKDYISCRYLSAKLPGQVLLTAINPDRTSVEILVQDEPGQSPTSLGQIPGTQAAISSDGLLVVVSSDQGKTMNVIETDVKASPAEPCTDQDDGTVTRCCISSNHRLIASAHSNGVIKLWKKTDNRWEVFRRCLVPGGTELNSWFLEFSADGSQLAFEDDDIKVWTISNDKVLPLEGSFRSTCMSWDPSTSLLASGDVDGNVTFWNGDQTMPVHYFITPHLYIVSIAFRHDGRVLATGDDAGSIKVWASGSWEKLWSFSLDDSSEYVVSLAFSPDGQQLLSGGHTGSFDIWDVDIDPPKDATEAIY